MKMKIRSLLLISGFSILALLGVANSADSTSSPEPKYDPATGFVIAPGYKSTLQCIACHSAKIIIQQGLTRSGWLDTVESMQEDHGMWELPPDQLEEILDYLSANYGTERPHYKTE